MRLSWQVLAHAPIASRASRVLVTFDEDGDPKAVLLA
jgi:hypothetical protein